MTDAFTKWSISLLHLFLQLYCICSECLHLHNVWNFLLIGMHHIEWEMYAFELSYIH